MERFDRKDASGMLMVFVAIAAIPLSVWIMRPRPLYAASSAELSTLIRDSRQEEVLTQMSKRYEAMSLNFEGPDPGTDPKVRWQEIQNAIEEDGAETSEAQKVVRIAQVKLKNHWPCLVERGYVQGEPVWLVVGSSPHDTGFISWICPPSANDIRQERIGKYCTNIQVAVVNAASPE